MNLEIVRDLKILRKPCREVDPAELLQPQTQKLIEEITSIIVNYNGAKGRGIRKGNLTGLAANQVGYDMRIFVGYLDDQQTFPIAVINPQVSKSQGQRRSSEECVSLLGTRLFLTRAERLVLRALDRGGHEFEKHVSGLYAASVLHEIDHLNGKLITDRR